MAAPAPQPALTAPQEGMRGDWGANIGKVLRDHYGDDIKIRARYMAAAGSDARMSGSFFSMSTMLVW